MCVFILFIVFIYFICFLRICSPARAMASCGSAAQRGLWPPVALQPSADYDLLIPRGFLITHNDAPQSVGLLWMNNQPVAETSTWQHTTDKHPCPRWEFFYFDSMSLYTSTFYVTYDYDRSWRVTVDLRLRPRSHWYRLYLLCLKHFSFQEELSKISKMYIGLHVK
jgi:hypothetical protein